MKAAEAKSLITRALDQLAADLDNGKSASLLTYLQAMGQFHRYSFHNVCLIYSQCPRATRVAGLRAWNRFNRYVKRGEKGIMILAPMVFTRKPEACPFEATGTYSDPQRRTGIRFRAVHVFDITQTEGEPLPQAPAMSGDPADHLDRLRGHVRSSGITLEDDEALGGAEGVSTGGGIRLRPDLTPAREFATLVHELAHEKLHRGEDRRTISPTTRELEAEAVAFVVSHSIGLETGTASSDYIALYGGDKAALTACLARVQTAAGEIIGALRGETSYADAPEPAAA